jgi:hypothetical protein
MVDDFEPWELHSELVLVSPEVYRRALELLPERDPDAFLTRREQIAEATPPSDEKEIPALTSMILGYTLRQLGHSARFALALIVGSVVLALLAELLR